MRRLIHDESGVAAVMVAILAIVLFGVAAIVIDLGVLYEERRQLQNGADAAALAIAWECAQIGEGSVNCPGAGTFDTLDPDVTDYAGLYAAGNARDDTASVLDSSEINFDAAWVQVDLESDAPITPFFGRILGSGSNTVRAAAAASWEPGGFAPLAFGTCELGYLLDAQLVMGYWERTSGAKKPLTQIADPGGSYTFVRTDPSGYAQSDVGKWLRNHVLYSTTTDLVAATDFSSASFNTSIITFQSGTPANDACQEASGQDKETSEDITGAGTFGWYDFPGCNAPIPESGLSDLWIEKASGGDEPADCGPEDVTGTIAILVFSDSEQLKANTDPFALPAPPTASPYCPLTTSSSSASDITCDLSAYILLYAVEGWHFNFGGSDGTGPGCDSSPSPSADCLEGTVVDVLSLAEARDELPPYVYLIPLPTS